MLTSLLEPVTVSVIIPTLNAGEAFPKLLKKLNEQSIKPNEILIIDSESTDKTVFYAQQAGATVVPILRQDFDHGGTRNIAAHHAKGDILLFMTQDVVPVDHKLIEQLITPLIGEAHKETEAVYSYARQIADESAHIFEKLARANNYPEHSSVKGIDDIETLGIKTFFCSNACSAIRKDIFIEQGGFTAPSIFNEDLLLAAKCVLLSGKKIAYAADAKVYHTHDYTVVQQFKRFFDNGVSMRLNPWILPYAKVGKAGGGLVKKQVKGLLANKKWYLLPRLVLELAAKLIGYKLGMQAHRLPLSFAKAFSMHKGIWQKISPLVYVKHAQVKRRERSM